MDEPTVAGPLPAPLTVPGYTVMTELGRGGMAAVYRARQDRLNREVALKVMEPTGDEELDAEFVQRFVREAQTASRFSHPNIVTIHDFGQHDERLWMAMELCPGGTLRQHQERFRDPAAACRLILVIADALRYLHHNGIIHRDVKPANILFRADDTPVLTDFGIIKAQDTTRLTELGLVVGTPAYLSAEQVKGGEAEPASDFFSLGVMFYELLTGEKPFNGLARDADKRSPLPRELGRFQPVVDGLLAVDPRERIHTVERLREVLEPILNPPHRAMRHGWVAAALVGVAALTATVVARWPQTADDGPPPPPPLPETLTELTPQLRDLLDTAIKHREANRLVLPATSSALAAVCRVVADAPTNAGVLAYLDTLIYEIGGQAPTIALKASDKVLLPGDLRPCLESALDPQRKAKLQSAVAGLNTGDS